MSQEKKDDTLVDEWSADYDELDRQLEAGALPERSILPAIMFMLFGGLAAIPTAIIVTYATHYIIKIPNATKDPENLSEFLGILSACIILAIFGGCKWYYKRFCRGRCTVRINFVSAALIGIVLAFLGAFVITHTEYFIASGAIFGSGNLIILSIIRHPILMFGIIVSCIISLWSTMPEVVKDIVKFAGILGIVED